MCPRFTPAFGVNLGSRDISRRLPSLSREQGFPGYRPRNGHEPWGTGPGYFSLTNRYALGGTSYDANGNLLNDSFHTYTWNASSRPITIDTIGLTYDAFDRMVEQNQSGTFSQIVYTPLGSKLGVFNGQTIKQLYLPLPGGAQAEYLSWGLSHYRHADWLGNNRLESSTTRTILDNNAYAPFGEPYVQTGNGEISFTGQNKDTDWLQYDFLARQYDPKQGRWISPDPAGLGAVDPANPQSWNRYVYVRNNPLRAVDPLGLDCTIFGPDGSQQPCGGGGGGYCPPRFAYCGDDPFPPDGGGPGGGDGGGDGGPNPPADGGGGSKPPANGNGHVPWSEMGVPQMPLTVGDLFGLTPGCDSWVCPALVSGFEDATALAPAVGLCAVTPGCQEVLLGGLVFVTTVAAIDAGRLYRSNVVQNRQFKEAVRQIESRCGKLSDDQKRRLHDEITRGGFSLPEIVEIGVGMFCPGK